MPSIRDDVNQLAALAQEGDKAAQNALWYAVKKWAYSVAKEYLPLVQNRGAYSSEDLKQCAGVGVLLAVSTYDPIKGGFLTWCSYYIRNECRKLLGMCDRAADPFVPVASLDAPISDAEDLTLYDMIQDDAAADRLEDAERRADNEILRADLLQAMQRLPESSRHMIHRHDLDGLTLQAAAGEMGASMERGRQFRITGLRMLRQNGPLRHLYKPRYCRYKGLKSYNLTFSSVVEDEAIKHLDSERRITTWKNTWPS